MRKSCHYEKEKRKKTYRSKTEDDRFGPHDFRVEFVEFFLNLNRINKRKS